MYKLSLYDDDLEEKLDDLRAYMEYIGPTSQSATFEALINLAYGTLDYFSEDFLRILERDLDKLYRFFKENAEIVETTEVVTKTITYEDLRWKVSEHQLDLIFD